MNVFTLYIHKKGKYKGLTSWHQKDCPRENYRDLTEVYENCNTKNKSGFFPENK